MRVEKIINRLSCLLAFCFCFSVDHIVNAGFDLTLQVSIGGEVQVGAGGPYQGFGVVNYSNVTDGITLKAIPEFNVSNFDLAPVRIVYGDVLSKGLGLTTGRFNKWVDQNGPVSLDNPPGEHFERELVLSGSFGVRSVEALFWESLDVADVQNVEFSFDNGLNWVPASGHYRFSVFTVTLDWAGVMNQVSLGNLSYGVEKDVLLRLENYEGRSDETDFKVLVDFAPSSVPEPSSILLLGGAFGVAGWLRSRRRTAARKS